MPVHSTLEVDGAPVRVSNLEKIFYPAAGFTKAQVIDYYIKISPVLLPHLRKRPISLKRYPDGVEGSYFYEKQCPPHRPDWVKTIPVEKSNGGSIDYCAINELSSLVWAANLANLELHTFLHCAPALLRPTAVAFDLDPGTPATMVQCCRVALWIKTICDTLGLKSFPKTSGSKGLQVYIPLNTSVTYARTRKFAHEMALLLEREYPEQVVSRMAKNLRGGKIFVDWSQNDSKKTTVTVYSLRAKEQPTVSTPVTWDEVNAAWKRKRPLSFDSKSVLKRMEKHGDLFEPVLTLKQKLPPASALAELAARAGQGS